MISLTPLVIQLLSCVQLFAAPWTAARQASLSITISHSLISTYKAQQHFYTLAVNNSKIKLRKQSNYEYQKE